MVFAKITGVIIIAFGILIGLFHFSVLPARIQGIDFVPIGILVFIAHEALALFQNSGSANKLIAFGVPIIFILVASSYFVISIMPEKISSVIPLAIAILMCAEGLYRLH